MVQENKMYWMLFASYSENLDQNLYGQSHWQGKAEIRSVGFAPADNIGAGSYFFTGESSPSISGTNDAGQFGKKSPKRESALMS